MTRTPQSLVPREFSFATPHELGTHGYHVVCQNAGLRPVRDGYAMLHALDENGRRWTLVTDDVEYLRTLAQAPPTAREGMVLPSNKFLVRPGWPSEWT